MEAPTIDTKSQYHSKIKNSQHPGQRGPIPPAFTAIKFAARGVIVHELNVKIPVAADWNTRTVAPTTGDIRGWRWGCNYGVLTGSRNRNLVVIDLDTPEMITLFEQTFKNLNDTYIVKTRRGQHNYYYCDVLPTTIKIPGKIELMADDLDGQGGKNVVGEGSVHETGHVYTGNGKKIMRVADLAGVVGHIESLKPARQVEQKISRRDYSGGLNAYYAKILAEETANIASAPDGAGNETVYRSCLKIFDAVKSGGISEGQARAEIAGALAGWTYRKHGDQRAIERTIESAWERSAPGMNGRNPRSYEPARTVGTIVPEIAVEAVTPLPMVAENSAMPETLLPTLVKVHTDAILSSILRCDEKVAPLFYLIATSGLNTFTREQIKALAIARGWSEGTFKRNWPLLFSPEVSLLECLGGENIHSKSETEWRVMPCIGVIAQLRELEAKRILPEFHPTGAPPKFGEEDTRVVALQTAAMVRDSGITENPDIIAAELNRKLQPAFDAQGHTEVIALRRAKKEFRRICDSFDDTHQTFIPTTARIHTVPDLRAAYANAYATEHEGQLISRAEWKRLLGCSDSGLKDILARAGVVGETPDELPALAIRSAADIDRIISHGRVVKGFPLKVVYETPDGQEVQRGIDARSNPQGMHRVCEMALQFGTAVKVVYQTAKEYHVASEPLPTKERVIREVGEGETVKKIDFAPPQEQVESEPTDPRKYPRRWLVGQYQLALERMGWKWAKGGGMLVNPETHETAPDNPRELIELILGRSLAPMVPIGSDPDYYERESTEYELNARHDYRMELINQGYRPLQERV